MEPNFFYLESMKTTINLNHVTQVDEAVPSLIAGKNVIRIRFLNGYEITLPENNPDAEALKEVLAEFNYTVTA